MRTRLLLAFLFGFSALFVSAQPLSGDYTINSALATGGENFQSFSDFAAALNASGVDGHITATVEPGSGPYVEQVVFDNIAGTGPEATITLDGSGETITALTDADNRHVVRLKDCQYFTIDNLHVERDPTAASGFYAIHVFSSGSHITIRNCSANMTGNTSTLVGAYIVSGSETSILTGGLFHDITITNNSSEGGGYGVSVFGLAAPNLATNIEIAHNQLLNAHSNAIYIRETDGIDIHHNFIDKTTTNITSWNAIQIAQNANINARIYNNYIQISQTANGTMTFRGIYLFNGTGHKVYNNIIANIQLESGNVAGIEVRSAATAPEIYFNTISFDKPANTSGELAGIKESLSNTNSVLRNNLISMSQPSSNLKAALMLGATANPSTAFNSDYNILFIPGGYTAYKGGLTPAIYANLPAWQAASGQDANSHDTDPELASLILPTPANNALDNKGTPYGGVSLDYFGVNRGTPPDIGAIEFGNCPPPDVPEAVFGETELCENESGAAYSIDPIPGATNYTWTVPAGAAITAGQGTTAITVDFGTVSGNITVAAEDSCGIGAPAILPVSLLAIPEQPDPIDGPTELCIFSEVTFSVPEVPGATTYTWTLPFGGQILSGQGTPTVVMVFGDQSDEVTVTAENDCGSSPLVAIFVEVFPFTPVTLNIPDDTLCLNSGPYTLTGGNPVDGIYSGPGVTDGVFDPVEAGIGAHTITLTYEDEFGCTFSDTDILYVDACAGVSGLLAEAGLLNLHPNPTEGLFRISGAETALLHIRLFNQQGQTLLEMEGARYVDLSAMPSGLYFLNIRVHDRIWTGKVVKH